MARPQLTVVDRDRNRRDRTRRDGDARRNRDDGDAQHSDRSRRAGLGDGTGAVATALGFSEAVRAVIDLCHRGGLVAPVFRSPPRLEGVDRTIRRRVGRTPVVAIRRAGRPLAAVQSDVIEAAVVANDLGRGRAERFRRAAWSALSGPSMPPAHPPSEDEQVA